MQSFAELGVSSRVVTALAGRGFVDPFPVQRAVLPDVLAGRDVLVQSPTGSGKTLAFGIPLVDRVRRGGDAPAALVLAPTRELAAQIVDELDLIAEARELRITAVYGGVPLGKQARLAGRSDVLVATPGRLLDLIERGAVSLGRVRILVLDEADRMLDMGFKPAVERIVGMTPRARQTLLFSATLEGEVGRVAADFTRDPLTHEIAGPRRERGRVEHRFVRLAHEDKLDRLVYDLTREERGRTLVFVRTKRGADRLVKRLGRHRVTAAAMHGDKSQGQRERALAQFEDGRVDTLVATDVAARGIDVADITHVINFDAPAAREDYVHRIGRTARAGATGVGITFVIDEQAADVARFANDLGLHREIEGAGLSFPERRNRRNRDGRRRQARSRPR